MTSHWRLALWGAAWIAALAIPVGAIVFYFYGGSHAMAFYYGVVIGLTSFVSTAVTVSLLMGRSRAGGMAIGGASFMMRYGFAAGALGIPAYLDLWPVVAMLVGFAKVYLAENVVLLPRVPKISRRHSAGEKVERRAEA